MSAKKLKSIKNIPYPVKSQLLDNSKAGNRLVIILILLLTFLSFYPVIHCQFTTWDDPLYVTENNLIRNLSFDNIKKFFSIDYSVALNYHPITILSFAIDYHFFKLNPTFYHLENLLIHLLNTLLVFIFVFRLTGFKKFPAVFVSVLFGIHPMHVESVAWISERKDVLYTLFFLASLISYLEFNQSRKIKFFILTFLFFLLSVLSKAMGVVLPLALILIDYYQDKRISVKSLAQKIPFLIISIIFGIIAINVQLKGAIASFETFSLLKRLSFAFYGIGTYLLKLFFPAGLSSFYPYPLQGTNVAFPVSFYLRVLLGCIFLVSLIILIVKNKSRLKPLFFGAGFFLVTIFMVLQFISVGQAIIADRYTYLSYVGLFFPLGIFLNNYIVKNPSLKLNVYIAFTIIALTYSFLTFERISVWKNTETLWTNVIDQYPYPPWTIELAYVGRGKYYAAEKNDLEKAFADFNTLESMNSKNATVYNNLGNIYAMKAQETENSGDSLMTADYYNKSMVNFKKSLSLDDTVINTYINRGTALVLMKKYEQAAADFDKALQFNPNNIDLVEKRAFSNYKAEKWNEAIRDYDFLISKIPEKSYLFQYRGSSRVKLGFYKEAIEDLNMSIQREPKNGQSYYYLSLCYYQLGNKEASVLYLNNAIQNGYRPNADYVKMILGK